MSFVGLEDRIRVEAEGAWEARATPRTIHRFLAAAARDHAARPAVSFQITSGPADRAETLTWAQLHAQVTRAANLLRRLGIGPADRVALVLPNATETAVALLGAMVAGVVCPINALLEPAQIAAILNETGAKGVITLAPFPKSDLNQKVTAALAEAPGVTFVAEIDLAHHVGGLKRALIPLVRPKRAPDPRPVTRLNFTKALAAEPATLAFDDPEADRIAALFHTGGTTGAPKLAQHLVSGMIYNGWLGGTLLFSEADVLICPLPLFHVFAVYPILMSCIASGAHMVLPTPAGYRGEGVFDNFWKLIARWQVTFLITVPTAIAALMQRPVDADVSSLRMAISGSAPLPVELYQRFKSATGVEIAEGYGLTEVTCLVSCNPPDGPKKVGSVGIPMPYTQIRILKGPHHAPEDCATDEIGEICVSSPGVFPGSTYLQTDRNRDLFAQGAFLRTGDLGRLDADGYLWITGRSKDLIIRGGHNIDPGAIEAALLSHPAVAFAGAIGQPDAFAGELPCAYVELVKDAEVTPEALIAHVSGLLPERAMIPKHLEILAELPKTAVGKIFKPALRRLAIPRVLDASLEGTGCHVREVVEDPRRGLVARIGAGEGADRAAASARLGEFALPWDWS
ncbi:acyl-CoA synthetase [Frigidibacter sp. MR17.14]|uniref:acyl-CoA synthetase n=1 Tax=Frigidibacter sp. MR17.14 TaxID=3126509 RepID=UPI003012D822